MSRGHMKIRAVIFDIYGTLFQIGPPPTKADDSWQELFKEFFKSEPPLSRLSFSVACSRAIANRNTNAHGRGIPRPEVLWPSVVGEVLPKFAKLSEEKQVDFVYRQMQLGRSISLARGVPDMLRWLAGKKCLLGVASNGQAYTVQELEALLKKERIKPEIFDSEVRFISFRHGFAKPDPHVFQLIRMGLESRGVRPVQTLVVGDRLDNDIEPARVHGFNTWHLCSSSPEKQSGTLSQLREHLVRWV